MARDLSWGPPFFQVTCFFCYVVLWWHLTKEKPGILYSARTITINFGRMLTYFEVLSLTRHISLRSIGHLRSRNKIKKVISPLPKSLYIYQTVGLSFTKSHAPHAPLYITWQYKNVISSLPKKLRTSHLEKWKFTVRGSKPQSYDPWSRFHMMSRDKLETLYFPFRKTYDQPNWQVGDLSRVMGSQLMKSYVPFLKRSCDVTW